MIEAPTPAEAALKLEREVLAKAAKCTRVRFFPYPCSDRRLVIVCAELSSGDDIQCLTRLPFAIDPDNFDEAAVAAIFTMPSAAVH